MACRYLEALGFEVLCRNYRCRSGEIDIVARDPEGTTVFVEVKDRRVVSHGEGYEAVTFGKRRRVVRAARLYAATHGLSESRLRFDVVSISWRTARSPRSGTTRERSIRKGPEGLRKDGAGNGIRTRDFDLGKVALYR